jgi:hypothetical protein
MHQIIEIQHKMAVSCAKRELGRNSSHLLQDRPLSPVANLAYGGFLPEASTSVSRIYNAIKFNAQNT